MNSNLQQLVDASEKVAQQLKILLESEQGKRQALLNRDSDKIHNFVQMQQAIVMKLDSLERKRYQVQEELGFAGKTATQILAMIDEDVRKVVAPVFEELKLLTDELQNLNRISLDIANTELKLMEMTSRQHKEESAGIYTSGGKTGGYSPNGSSFHEKI